jgi:hypothetical protein
MSVEAQAHDTGRASRRRRCSRLAATVGSLAVHALVLSAVLASWGHPPIIPEPPAMEVTLVTPPPPPPVIVAPAAADPAPDSTPAKAAGPPKPTPPKPAPVHAPPPPQRMVKAPPPPEVPRRYVPPEPTPPRTEPSVSAAELASATTADSEAAGEGGLGAGGGDGSGGGGGSGSGGRCDMVQRLQKALRNDAGVRAAIAQVHRAPGFEGRPLVVWNGDWVRHGDEDGKGLASVRQAIAVEVGFAPKACRSQPMRGLVMLSLNDSPGSRVVLGAGAWRWSDLLLIR